MAFLTAKNWYLFLFLDIRNPFPNMNPQAQARTAPGGLNREEDAVADIIKLEDKSPPAPLNNAHQKFANVSSISNQVITVKNLNGRVVCYLGRLWAIGIVLKIKLQLYFRLEIIYKQKHDVFPFLR